MNVTNDRFKDRQLHIGDYLQMVSTESKEYAEVSACQRIAENNRIITDFQTDRLLDKILQPSNLNNAYKKVKSNKGAGGVDGTAGKIEAIIRDEKYTGTMVQLKTKLDSVGGKQVSRPKEEWVRVENTHEPVITYPQYIRAVSSLKQQKASESRKKKNIYYCGCCGRALFNAHYGTIFCKQRSFKTGSDCSDIEINKHEADMAVLASVKKEAEIFLDRDKLSRQVIKRNSPLSVSDTINSTMRSIEAAQKSWIALYDKYADGKLEREFFLNEKKQYDADMEKLEEELAALRQAQEEEESEQEGSQRKADQAMAFLEEEELTEDMKDKLIEKVVVYPGNRIEIVWKFEGHF